MRGYTTIWERFVDDTGGLPGAIAEYEAAVRIDLGYADAHSNLAAALAKMPGRESEAMAQYQAALRLKRMMRAEENR